MTHMRQQLADYRVFLREFLRTFQTTGAVMPSGSALAAALAHYVRDGDEGSGGGGGLEGGAGAGGGGAAHCPRGGGRGPGAGTHHIARAMRGGARRVLVEGNEVFVDRLRERIAVDESLQPLMER